MDLDPAEVRVLGCLIEKQRVSPDSYPLSLNALRAACNQSTSRDPVVDYDDALIRDALARLSRRRYARLASGAGSRAAKYRHLLDDALGLPEPELAALCVLMLRGPQTAAEIKQRSERLYPFADPAAAQAALDGLQARDLVARRERRRGEKGERWAHTLSDEADADVGQPSPPSGQPEPATDQPSAPPAQSSPPPASASQPHLDRLAELEARVEAVEAEVARLRGEPGG